MKLRPALLLCVSILFATAPAWADRISLCESTKLFPAEISADFGHCFEVTSNGMHGQPFEPSAAKQSFFSFSSSRKDVSADVIGLGSYGRFADHTRPRMARIDGREGDGTPLSGDSVPASVPEPATLSLLMLGAGAVGIFARRR